MRAVASVHRCNSS